MGPAHLLLKSLIINLQSLSVNNWSTWWCLRHTSVLSSYGFSFASSGASRVKFKTGPSVHRGQGETKKEEDHLRLAGCSFNKEGDVLRRFVLSDCKMRSPHPLARILVYIEVLTGFSQVHHPDSLHNTSLSQDWVFDDCSHYGNGVQNVYSKDRGGGAAAMAQVQVTGQPAIMSSDDLFQHHYIWWLSS